MPWTFAHPAAVLPFRRACGPGRLSFAALVVGSLSPDFGYYIGRFDLAGLAHTPIGLVSVCLPSGLLVLVVVQRLRGPVARLLPEPHLSATLALPAFSIQASLPFTVLSLLLGASTHVVWDSFTHERRFLVEHSTVLQTPLFNLLGRDFRVFNLLQHGSTVIGVAFLAIAYGRCVARIRSSRLAGPAPDIRRYGFLAALGLAAFIVAAPLAIVEAASDGGTVDLSKLIVRQTMYATTVFFVLLACAALLAEARDGVV